MRRAGPVVGHALLLALVLGLAGCFKSNEPLLDAAQAKYPFKSATFKADDGEIETLRREGDVYRRIEDGKPRSEALLFFEIEENVYLVQETGDIGVTTYLYARKERDKAVVMSDCQDIKRETLTSFNFEFKAIAKRCSSNATPRT
ncbi:MAG: hypothetical protein HC774_08240 [Sphingomonadales bacterium]|nr:hypothetical protein [Sphingomonadales bacterium]